jgi:hypothetical protein
VDGMRDTRETNPITTKVNNMIALLDAVIRQSGNNYMTLLGVGDPSAECTEAIRKQSRQKP